MCIQQHTGAVLLWNMSSAWPSLQLLTLVMVAHCFYTHGHARTHTRIRHEMVSTFVKSWVLCPSCPFAPSFLTQRTEFHSTEHYCRLNNMIDVMFRGLLSERRTGIYVLLELVCVFHPRRTFWVRWHCMFVTGNGWCSGAGGGHRYLLLSGGVQPLHGTRVCHAGVSAKWWREYTFTTLICWYSVLKKCRWQRCFSLKTLESWHKCARPNSYFLVFLGHPAHQPYHRTHDLWHRPRTRWSSAADGSASNSGGPRKHARYCKCEFACSFQTHELLSMLLMIFECVCLVLHDPHVSAQCCTLWPNSALHPRVRSATISSLVFLLHQKLFVWREAALSLCLTKDVSTYRPQKTEKTEFLSFFYKHCMHVLSAPLLANTTEEKPSKGTDCQGDEAECFMLSSYMMIQGWCLSVFSLSEDDFQTSQLLALILELLTFCVEHHTYHIKNYIINKDILRRVLVLTASQHAFLALCELPVPKSQLRT